LDGYKPLKIKEVYRPMGDKTKEELQTELNLLTELNKQRVISDARYAVKLVEVAVWGIIGVGGSAIIIAIIKGAMN
jgi:hypothetical protein